MIRKWFLSDADRQYFLKLVRNKNEGGGIVRRANAMLLLDKGWICADVGVALFLDDDTIRDWHKRFIDGGMDHLFMFDWKGALSRLSLDQETLLCHWISAEFPTDSSQIAAWIETKFAVTYSHSGILSLLHRLGFDYIRPKHQPQKIDEPAQEVFIQQYEEILNSQSDDEVVLFADAVHPEHQSRPAKGWAKRDNQVITVKSNSGRKRMNIHGAFNLETGDFIHVCPDMANAESTLSLLQALEAKYPKKRCIHLFLDNARYHHANLVKDWLARPGCRIKMLFLPPYCP